MVCFLSQKVSNKTFPKLKEVDDVLGGSAAWENVDWTETTCPKCDNDKAFFMQVGNACIFLSNSLNFTLLNPYIAVVILGVAYSLLASALWPICALIIPEYQLGTAYGLMQVF